MAVIVKTDMPNTLLKELKEKVVKDVEIKTWSIDSDGDFTHTTSQWVRKAWFRPKVEVGELVFRILSPKGTHLSREVYAIYHGRFIEMLLAHFDTKFSNAEATALASRGDIINPAA